MIVRGQRIRPSTKQRHVEMAVWLQNMKAHPCKPDSWCLFTDFFSLWGSDPCVLKRHTTISCREASAAALWLCGCRARVESGTHNDNRLILLFTIAAIFVLDVYCICVLMCFLCILLWMRLNWWPLELSCGLQYNSSSLSLLMTVAAMQAVLSSCVLWGIIMNVLDGLCMQIKTELWDVILSF